MSPSNTHGEKIDKLGCEIHLSFHFSRKLLSKQDTVSWIQWCCQHRDDDFIMVTPTSLSCHQHEPSPTSILYVSL